MLLVAFSRVYGQLACVTPTEFRNRNPNCSLQKQCLITIKERNTFAFSTHGNLNKQNIF